MKERERKRERVCVIGKGISIFFQEICSLKSKHLVYLFLVFNHFLLTLLFTLLRIF